MENQANSKNIILNYGLYLGGISVLMSLTLYALGMHLDAHWSVGIVGFLITVALIVIGIKKFKEANGGFTSWGQAVKIGVGIALISSIIVAVYQLIFMAFIEPDFMAQIAEKQNQVMIDSGYTEEQMEAAKGMSEKMQSPAILSAMNILGGVFVGFIISAIAGAIMKKSEEEQY